MYRQKTKILKVLNDDGTKIRVSKQADHTIIPRPAILSQRRSPHPKGFVFFSPIALTHGHTAGVFDTTSDVVLKNTVETAPEEDGPDTVLQNLLQRAKISDQ